MNRTPTNKADTSESNIILIGYSGHAYVVCDILLSANHTIFGYGEKSEKSNNPYHLKYIGDDSQPQVLFDYQSNPFFIAIGENSIRKKVFDNFIAKELKIINAIHQTAYISHTASLNGVGIMIGAGVIVNPLASIGNGVICNTGSIIEHECIIGDFVHLAPGSVLCGNVSVGENTFIGANSVVKQGVNIGKNCLIGAGSVVIKDVPDFSIIAGNPAKSIKK
jgi:sugar O-acyltransferase (sialic acid O-acetyltransferase NeuD family)